MQGNESYASHVNINQLRQENTAESSLITLERSQKLDLLIHLISNLKQSLVLCGPKGIGKTVLLDEFKILKQDVWPVYAINATTQLSFESFQDQLSAFLKQINEQPGNHDLLSVLSGLDKQNKKVVIIIDEAGQLVPGLINAIIQYASATECLRVVFSLTHDELHIKNSSDRNVDDCHFIDIPPLTKKQCGVFLQNLSAKPDAIVSFEAISDRLVDKLYLETHGIPGRIVSELPKLSNYQAVAGYSWGSAALIAAIIAIGIGFILDKKTDSSNQEKIKTSVILKKTEVVEISSPVIQMVEMDSIEDGPGLVSGQEETKGPKSLTKTKIVESSSLITKTVKKDLINALSHTQSVEKKEKSIVVPAQKTVIKTDANRIANDEERIIIETLSPLKQEIKLKNLKHNSSLESGVVDKLQVNEPLAIKVLPTQKKVKALSVVGQHNIKIVEKKTKLTNDKKSQGKVIKISEKDDSRWVLGQSEKYFTIQLMVLSKRKSVIDFFEQNNALKHSLKYIKLSKKNQNKYTIIYGTFKNAKIALKQMNLLPVEYRKSWVRKFRDLQKEIKK